MDDDALITWMGDEFPSPLRAIIARIAAEHAPEITIEQGWWPLLVRLDAQLGAISPDYRIRRVGSEAGRLRFELERPVAEHDLRKVIHAAKDESARTCEVCGRPGSPRLSGLAFYRVLCEEDAGFSPGQAPDVPAETVATITVAARRLIKAFDDVPWPQMDALFYMHAYDEFRLILEDLINAVERDNTDP